EFAVPALPDPLGICRLFGESRSGLASVIGGAFQRLGVTPDGSGVVFEVNDDFSILAPNFLRSEYECLSFVRADGPGLRRLGPARRDPPYRLDPVPPGLPLSAALDPGWDLSFSPNGRRFAITDLGPGPSGKQAPQVFVIDVATGKRTQVTRLPPTSGGDVLRG